MVVGVIEQFSILYIVRQNTVIAVSKKLLDLLLQIRKKFNNLPLDQNNENVKLLLASSCIEKLKAQKLVTNNNFYYEDRYKVYSDKISDVYLHVSMECNLNCTYCYAQRTLKSGKEMSYNLATMIIDKLMLHEVQTIILTGGEPFLNSNLDSIARYIKEKNSDIALSLITNGTKLSNSPEILEYFDQITVSVDVGESSNRHGLAIPEIISCLKNLSDAVKIRTIVRSVISKGDEHLILKMRELVESWGLSYVVVPRLPNEPDDLKYLPNLCVIPDVVLNDARYRPSRCGAATSVIAIDTNGDVYPCQALVKPDFKITSMFSDTWEADIRGSKISKDFKLANVLTIRGCSNCNFRFACGGGCRALSHNVYESLYHRLDFMCEHFRENAKKNILSMNFKGVLS